MAALAKALRVGQLLHLMNSQQSSYQLLSMPSTQGHMHANPNTHTHTHSPVSMPARAHARIHGKAETPPLPAQLRQIRFLRTTLRERAQPLLGRVHGCLPVLLPAVLHERGGPIAAAGGGTDGSGCDSERCDSDL
jgi:hypothetical protein